MIDGVRPWLMPVARQPRRCRLACQPLLEPVEARPLLSASLTADIGGLTLAVVSLKMPQPTASRTQDISLVVKPSKGVTKLLQDYETGKILHNVSITLNLGKHGKDTIDLKNAVIASYQVIQDPSLDEPEIALSLDGQTKRTGSITATIDGITPAVVSLTIPRPTSSGAQDISLVVKVSEGVKNLFADTETGKVIPEVEISLDQVGNGSIETISLTNALISSIQFVSAGDIREVAITLAAGRETVGNS
jgi:type VI protein secretion system component Hcp